MANAGYQVSRRMTQAEVNSEGANITGGLIEVVDASGQLTGAIMAAGAAGTTPSAVATSSDVQQAVAASLKKVGLIGTGSVALTYAAHNGAEVHAESGITECTMALTAFQASSVQQTGYFYLFNYSGTALPLKLGTGWSGGISQDGDLTNDLAGAGTLITIPHARTALVIFDADGWVRAGLIGQEVTKAQLDAVSNASVKLTGDQAIAGKKTFSTLPEVSADATTANQMVRKSQYDTKANSSALTDKSLDGAFKTLRSDRVRNLADNSDLNSLIEVGFFDVNNPTNAPVVSSGWWYVISLMHMNTANTNYRMQIARQITVSDAPIYIRINNNGVWGSWQQYLRTGDVKDNLTSTDTDKPLSANQGKTLQDGKAALASPTLTGTPAAPTATAGTNTTQLATTAFVMDAVTASLAGLDWKQSVQVATTGNITLSGTQTIDGVAVVAANRVLVKDQSTASQNGIYDVAAGAWARASDANANNEVSAGLSVYVESGTTNGTTVWTLTTAGNISLGTTNLTFTRLFNTSGLEQTSNKVTAFSSPTDVQYPSAKLVGDQLALKEATTNKGIAFSSPTDTQYPSAKLVNDQLAAKQATLASGSNIKTVNGASILGSGNVSVAADLPGGTPTAATDEGLGSGSATIDRSTVAGQTILRYTSSSTFKVPDNVTSVWALVVGGGASGDNGVASVAYGAGGGGGRVTERTAFAVTPGQTLTVTVGGGGTALTNQAGVNSNAGNQSVLGSLIAAGGGATVNSSPYSGGASGRDIDSVVTSFTGGSKYASGFAAGGGAGSAENGVAGTSTAGGRGGDGQASSITGTATNYSGGGGGANGSNAGAGGAGGGGAGANASATAGTANTGGGGGGSPLGAGISSGAGGSGVVIVRFATQTRSYQSLQSYADNAAALAGGRRIGEFYRSSSTGAVMQVV